LEQFRRTFDEWRALHDVHGWVQPLSLMRLQSEVRKDIRAMDGFPPREVARSLRHHTVRAAGAMLGSRAERLPVRVREWCSLERPGIS
jgi:hypothetical protein